MEDRKSKVLANETLGPGICCLWVDAPHIASSARPGEFVMATCGEGSDPFLRRAISVHRYGPVVMAREPGTQHPDWITATSVALLFNADGLARSWLGIREPGEEIEVLGPLGKGYELDPKARRIVMAGGGTGIAPLVALADEALASGTAVTLISGGGTEAALFPRERVQPDVEYVPVTEDGSVGRRGVITDPLADYIEEADQVFLCGPVAMYKTVYDIWHKLVIHKPTQVLLEVRMACGFGICYGCTIWTKNAGPQFCCKDGPMFKLEDVDWEKL